MQNILEQTFTLQQILDLANNQPLLSGFIAYLVGVIFIGIPSSMIIFKLDGKTLLLSVEEDPDNEEFNNFIKGVAVLFFPLTLFATAATLIFKVGGVGIKCFEKFIVWIGSKC